MKKILSTLIILTMLITSNGQSFANVETSNSSDIEVLNNNRYQTVYEYTEYEYHDTAIATEDDIARALQAASVELNILGFVVGGLAVKPVTAVLTTGTRKQIVATVTKYLSTMTVLGNSERIIGAGLTLVPFKAHKIVIEKKFKYQYSLDKLTGKKHKTNTWVTYKRRLFVRENAYSSWNYIDTDEVTLLLK